MARRAHRSSILLSSRTPDQLRVPRSEHLVHFSRRRCFEHNQRPEHWTCRRPRLDAARRAHPWPGTWCTYRRSQYERYSLAVTSDGKVGPSGVVLRPPHGAKRDNVAVRRAARTPYFSKFLIRGAMTFIGASLETPDTHSRLAVTGARHIPLCWWNNLYSGHFAQRGTLGPTQPLQSISSSAPSSRATRSASEPVQH